jgi:uncharacterized OB-fold protein
MVKVKYGLKMSKDKKLKPIINGIFNIESNKKPENLIGIKCKNCQKIAFPKKIICPYCSHSEIEEVPLSKRGKIYTYTICRVPVKNIKAPYAIGYIDLEEGVRIFSLFTNWKEEDLEIGKEVEVVFEKFKETEEEEIWIYKFRLIK